MRRNSLADVWKHIDKGAPNACWPWTKSRDGGGYGMFMVFGVRWKPHRAVLVLSGVDLTNKIALHSCDNPPCCNPAHLRAGTYADNAMDMVTRGRGGNLAGERVGNSRLTDEKVRAIREAYAKDPRGAVRQVSYGLRRRLATKYRVSLGTIHNAATRATWKHVR